MKTNTSFFEAVVIVEKVKKDYCFDMAMEKEEYMKIGQMFPIIP